MIKKFLKSSVGIFILSFLASLYIRFVFLTSRWTLKNFHIPNEYLQKNKPFLTCFWHGRLLMLPYGWVGHNHRPKRPFFMLISGHKDGKLISRTVQWFGIHTIIGSTNRGGAEAIRAILKTAKEGHTIGITPDGPRGPYESVSPGTIRIAQLGKMPLLPITFSTSRHKIFKSWDRFFLPLPFSKGTLIWGNPVQVHHESLEENQRAVQTALRDLTAEADAFVCAQ